MDEKSGMDVGREKEGREKQGERERGKNRRRKIRREGKGTKEMINDALKT